MTLPGVQKRAHKPHAEISKQQNDESNGRSSNRFPCEKPLGSIRYQVAESQVKDRSCPGASLIVIGAADATFVAKTSKLLTLHEPNRFIATVQASSPVGPRGNGPSPSRSTHSI